MTNSDLNTFFTTLAQPLPGHSRFSLVQSRSYDQFLASYWWRDMGEMPSSKSYGLNLHN